MIIMVIVIKEVYNSKYFVANIELKQRKNKKRWKA